MPIRLPKTVTAFTPIPIFSETSIQEYDTNGGTDWQDEIYRSASIQNHELSISGGTDNVRYLISGGFLNQEGILKNSGYKRYSIRANISSDINKWAAFGLNWAGTRESGNTPAFGSDVIHLGNAVNVAARWAPTEPVYDAEGNYSIHRSGYGASDTWNPLASALEPFLDNNINRNTLNGYFEFKPLEGLKLRITGGAIIRNLNNRNFYNNKTYEGRQNKGLGNNVEELSSRYQNSNILTYDKTMNSHHFTITAVAEQQYEKLNHSAARASDFMVDQTGVFDLAGANIVTNESNATERVINSYLGRINYVFKDRYLLTASYRADGSSVFGKDNRWGYFPSASLAWRASEEEFIKKMGIFTDLKFRASWGITGNQAISPYQTLSRISSGSNYPYNGGEATDLGFYISAAQNPKLKWESTTQSDLGIDLAMLKGRLTATADYYIKTTRDLLMPRGLPGYTGYESIIDNVGSIENKGFEFAVGGDPVVGTFKWHTGITFSANKNKVLDLGEIDRIGYRTTTGGYSVNNPFMYLVKGEPFGQIYGYGYEGTWKQADAANAAKYGQLPGDGKYTDLNNDGKIDGADLKVIGNAFPKFIFGWNNRMSFKNFDLSVLVQGSKGNDIFNQSRIRLEAPGAGTSARLLDRWTVENQDTDVPAFTPESVREEANLTGTVLISGDQRLSRWVEDGSYIRLKNVTLGYNFQSAKINKISLSNLRVYATATNLFTLTKYTGYDPEVSSFNGNDAMMGVDLGNYPQARMFSLGLNLAF
jgi:TonB-linked SusC/RagA family outer membrane protein